MAVYHVKDKSKPKKYLPLNDPTGMSRTFPNLTMGSDIWGCYDPAAGVLMADKVAAHFNPGLFNPKLLQGILFEIDCAIFTKIYMNCFVSS